MLIPAISWGKSSQNPKSHPRQKITKTQTNLNNASNSPYPRYVIPQNTESSVHTDDCFVFVLMILPSSLELLGWYHQFSQNMVSMHTSNSFSIHVCSIGLMWTLCMRRYTDNQVGCVENKRNTDNELTMKTAPSMLYHEKCCQSEAGISQSHRN